MKRITTSDRDTLLGTILEGLGRLASMRGETFSVEEQQEIITLSDKQSTEKLLMMANAFNIRMNTK